jgi:ATP-dependent helicase Lhr and Lhr-like helicase
LMLRENADWEPWFEALLAAGRAVQLETAAGKFWCALELRSTAVALFPDARFVPDLQPPAQLAARPVPAREELAARAVRGQLELCGPASASSLASVTGIDAATVALALAQLRHEGFALSGFFEHACTEEQYCARRLLDRIHRYTRDRLRREIEPVSPQDYMRFLLRWQGVTGDTKRAGQRGLSAAIEQLQGFEAAVASWEADVLPARVAGYRPEWLDALCFSGEVMWGRLSERSAPVPAQRSATISRATPVTLAFRGDLTWLQQSLRGPTTSEEALPRGASALLACLQQRGALFSSELMSELGVSWRELNEALWDAVARGRLTSDGFGALRSLLQRRLEEPRPAAPVFGLRRGGKRELSREGRWALLPEARAADDRDALAEAVAEQLLARWGVVFADVVARENLALPYRELSWALRRLEARGVVRGGRFVNGFVGEQYALPDAVEQLRAVRRLPHGGETVTLSACDPLNLIGSIVPGTKVPVQRGRSFTLVDGALAEPQTMPAQPA